MLNLKYVVLSPLPCNVLRLAVYEDLNSEWVLYIEHSDTGCICVVSQCGRNLEDEESVLGTGAVRNGKLPFFKTVSDGERIFF